jgi:hypothetical protein
MPHDPAQLWAFLPMGYLLTVLLETPVLLLGLSRPHSFARRMYCGFMLTACTYPIVVLVMPLVLMPHFSYATYVGVAEVFAPAAECAIFYFLVDRHELKLRPMQLAQDMAAIVAANLISWLVGARLFEVIRELFF